MIELFSHEVRERDPEIYALTEALGRQVGEFIEALDARQARPHKRGPQARRCSTPRSTP